MRNRSWEVRARLVIQCVLVSLAASATAGAAPISLIGGPLGATDAIPGSQIELTVDLDLNGFPAANVVSHQLWVGFTGLALQDAVPGTVYDGVPVDDFSLLSDCVSDPAFCSSGGAYALEWTSLVLVTPPAVGGTTGSLFRLTLAVLPGVTSWSLDVFGDPDYSLYWEPPGQCAPPDAPDDCPVISSPIDFEIVSPTRGTATVPGVARVEVGAVVAPPSVDVPEPTLLGLLSIGSGVAVALQRRRR